MKPTSRISIQFRIFGLLLALALLMTTMMVSAQTTPTSPINPTLCAADSRIGASFPGICAQTAAIYRSDTDLLMYEINDNGVGTFLAVVSTAEIDEKYEEATETDEAAVLFEADTYTVYVLPSGWCQFQSLQIPVAQGKTFNYRFICR